MYEAEPALPDPGRIAPLFGLAFLGLSGAYLLRSITESGAVPGVAGAVAGIVYGTGWLVLAARCIGQPLASTVHGVTAAFILAPMLWETTVRFHLMSLPVASGVLVAFVLFGLAIAWRHNITAVAWVTTLAALLTSFMMFREAHDGRIWALTVLAIATSVEFSACRDHWLSLRWITALSANITVLVLTWLTGRSTASADAVMMNPGFLLFVQAGLLSIYAASTVDRTLLRGISISAFEVFQVIVAFLITVGGALHLASVTKIGAAPLGVFCLAGAIACYLVSFTMLDRNKQQDRNFYTYSSFGAMLTMAACGLLLTGAPLVAAWSFLAGCLLTAGVVSGRTTLRVHGGVFLALAIATARILQDASSTLIRTSSPSAVIGIEYVFALFGAVWCYAVILAGRRRVPASHWTDQIEALIAATVVCWAGGGLLAAWTSGAGLAGSPLRTGVLTGLAAAAAWLGTRYARKELLWLAYPLLLAAGLKIFLEDFRLAHSFGMFVSLTLFGGALIALPQIFKRAAGGTEQRGTKVLRASA